MNIYKTDSLALCPYLQMNGLKYIKAELGIGRSDKPIVEFLFEDPSNMGRDLALDFMKSDIKAYRDIFFFFRNEIETLKRRVDHVQRVEGQQKDTKYKS